MRTFSTIDPDFAHKVLNNLHFDDLRNGDVSTQSAYNFHTSILQFYFT